MRCTFHTTRPIEITGHDRRDKQITDQAGKKRKGISDALGRMIRVIEDPTGQNLNTDYVFDTLGSLRKTMQGEQGRFFMHDSLGRLVYAKQPEQDANASFNASDAITGNTAWSVKYEFDDNGNITKTTDAKGTSVDGTYDKGHLIRKAETFHIHLEIFQDLLTKTPGKPKPHYNFNGVVK